MGEGLPGPQAARGEPLDTRFVTHDLKKPLANRMRIAMITIPH